MAKDNVTNLGVKNKRLEKTKKFLTSVPRSQCTHRRTSFILDEDAGKCYCEACSTEVTPIFVLNRLMQVESRWAMAGKRYNNEMKRLSERSSTKCQHCNKMTKISKR